MKLDEKAFETFICEWLVSDGGYQALKIGTKPEFAKDFDSARGLDLVELFSFIKATQAQDWASLVKLHGGDLENARRAFADRLAKELDSRGTVEVLRHGVIDLGVTIRLAYFKPAHGLTPELADRYDANRLTVTRQLPYEATSKNTVDVALFVNGIPVATAELKNETTGQDVEFAKRQYRFDRDPKNTTLSRRALVHFAVDSQEVAMTTRLAGRSTPFLPFNQGHNGGKGNPPNPSGHRTAYLWEEVWERHAWLDLLARFIHVEKPPKGSKERPKLIFPRFHQWDATLRLEEGARSEGAGHDYLIQHSAGSGKSNTIAWLAHRLSTLHDANENKIFDKVVVITDRKVLDWQLQDTVYQFEHAHGVVQKIDVDSKQLAEALSGAQARIIITTLQKFPVVLQMGVELPNRRYAVIVDEAHSSQTGESAKDLKLVLSGASEEQELTTAELEDAGFAAEPIDPVEEALAKAAGARGHQGNLSFFAFTATPKGRTLEMFGRKDADTKKHEPYHLYPMRQAIEEGFILDVLEKYITYETFWNIEKTVPDDPDLETRKAKTAIARFVTLHEHNLAQKAEVIVEHFKSNVSHKIRGHAKAMVVTASRLHAVRYKQALDKYIEAHGYDLGVLVAFSGTVYDGAADWTESKMNGFPSSQTATEFDTDAWQLLIVAEKYQTGFDQPMLYAMYVDKVLTGLAAVQTLSRLNRIADGKDGTFVLDFRNDAEGVRAAFEPWYGKTVAPPTDPNLLYDTHREVLEFDVVRGDEIEAAVSLIVTSEGVENLGKVHAALQPAIDRFDLLGEDDQIAFRDALNRFVRTYSFLSQVVAFTDTKLERDYIYCRALASFVKPSSAGALDLGSAVELTHLRMEKTYEGSLSLTHEQGEVTTIFSGTGRRHTADEEPLSRIIAELNERFGTSWTEADRVFYEAVATKLAERKDMQQAAAVNDPDNFKLVLEKEFMSGVVDQLNVAEDMTIKYLDNPELREAVLAAYVPLIYGKAKVAFQEHCPIGELLGPDKEGATLEYKASLRTHADSGLPAKVLETATLKTLAGFLNSRTGGTLLIGVANDGSVSGLDADYATLRKEQKDDRDLFQLHLSQIISASVGEAAATQITIQLHKVNGGDIARAHVLPSPLPVDATVTVEKQGQLEKKIAFYVRVNNRTIELPDAEKQKYMVTRWQS